MILVFWIKRLLISVGAQGMWRNSSPSNPHPDLLRKSSPSNPNPNPRRIVDLWDLGVLQKACLVLEEKRDQLNLRLMRKTFMSGWDSSRMRTRSGSGQTRLPSATKENLLNCPKTGSKLTKTSESCTWWVRLLTFVVDCHFIFFSVNVRLSNILWSKGGSAEQLHLPARRYHDNISLNILTDNLNLKDLKTPHTIKKSISSGKK